MKSKMNMKTKRVTSKDMALIWFDWKNAIDVLEPIDKLTDAGPLCFRLIEQDEEDEKLGYVSDTCYVVMSTQPISKERAKAFYRREMAKLQADEVG